MAKKKKKTKAQKRMMRQLRSAKENREHFGFHSYEITDEPLFIYPIPGEIQDEMGILYGKIYKSPESAIDRLEELLGQYPDVPQLYNHLSLAYSVMGNTEKSKYYIEKNCKKNPDYLFAKINYAETCLTEGEYGKVPEIFDHKFNLKALYPERDVFHISEVVAFMGVIGIYFLQAGERDKARFFYEALKKLAPGHHFTQKMKKSLISEPILTGQS